MALLDLFSVFNFYFKNGVTDSPFAGNHHSGTFCLIRKENRHLVIAVRALYPVHFIFFYFLNSYRLPTTAHL